jgi:hypothetical protein
MSAAFDSTDLKAQADALAASSAPNTSMGMMAKSLQTLAGVVDGLVSLAKGKKMKDEEEDEEEEETTEDPDSEAEEAAGAGAGGYQDMRQGTEAEIDVTAFLDELSKGVRSSNKTNVALLAELRSLRSEVKELRAGQVALAKGMSGGFMGLGEATLHMGKAISSAPSPSRTALGNVVARSIEAATDNGITKTKLSKALSSNLISQVQMKGFQLYGKFSDDPAESAAILAKVQAL